MPSCTYRSITKAIENTYGKPTESSTPIAALRKHSYSSSRSDRARGWENVASKGERFTYTHLVRAWRALDIYPLLRISPFFFAVLTN
ncbi:hypothetical protein POVWA2_048930 [Plasmodium ovale wallikeri]|uniref:Uncharacterized protein n=1 Tax=Plasmodium ovale wallikeri TaxID=864142 RepID=A0A1A8ZMD6_PLAOA|nr:hypothetical protein POVWA2_048930 [Plasmodium ovale wallikeri]